MIDRILVRRLLGKASRIIVIGVGLAVMGALGLMGILSGLVGPGAVIAGSEGVFGVGPWTKAGLYCTNMGVFARDTTRIIKSPSTTKVKNLTTDLAWLVKFAPNSNMKTDLYTWAAGEVRNDPGMISTSAESLNRWFRTSCDTFAMRAPADVAQYWSGFFGPSITQITWGPRR